MTAAEIPSLGTAAFAEVSAVRLVNAPLHAVASGMVMAGPALPLRCKPGDNLAQHRAITQAHPGDIDIGNAIIAPCDVRVADADAILILAADDLPFALAAAQYRARREALIKDRLRLGETTLAILGLPGTLPEKESRE